MIFATWIRECQNRQSIGNGRCTINPKRRETDRQLTLSDGRTLGFAEYGDATGYPVIYHHGGLSCRIDASSCESAARSAGVRVIAVDRPGIGLSQRHKGGALVGWPNDIAQLLEGLGIDKCATMGWSFGSAYATACALALGEVESLTLIGSGIPCDWPGMREQINRMDRRFLRLSRQHGWIAEATFFSMRQFAQRRPDAFVRRTTAGLTAQSVGAIENHRQEFVLATVEGLSDPGGVLDDYRIWDQPWGFDVSQLAKPTHIWHGTDDELCPVDWATRLGQTISTSTVHLVPGAGHFVAVDHWDEIFASVTSVNGLA